jgi:hypothetical protein
MTLGTVVRLVTSSKEIDDRTTYRQVTASAVRNCCPTVPSMTSMSAAADRRISRTPHVAERASGPGEYGRGTPSPTEGTKGVMPLVRRFGPSILINGVAPYVIYFVLHHQFQVAELPALLATSIPPLLDALVGIVRWRRIDFLAGLVLFTISLAVALVALGGDPRLYLIRESFITAGIGLAFIVSNPLPRPFGFFFARYFMAGNDQARLAWVNDHWQGSAGFRQAIRFSNVVWGLGFVLEAGVRTYLVFTLSIEQFLIASPIVFYGFYAVLLGWSVMFGRRKRQEAMVDQVRHGPGSSAREPA